MSDVFGSGGGTSPKGVIELCENTYRMCVSGSNEPPAQLDPPPAVASVSVTRGPSNLLTTAGVNIGPILYFETNVKASSRSAGVKSIKSAAETPCRSYAGGLVGNGCVGEYHSPG